MQFFLPIILAILYGVTMKVADLLNEHGLKWFKYSNILFGFFCGIFGSLSIFYTNYIIATVIIAQVISCIIRNRLDYLNHQIAATLILLAGFLSGFIEPIILLVFSGVFLLFGAIKDYFGDKLKTKGIWEKLSELMLYYPLSTFIYCLYFGNWILFWFFVFYTFSYNLTKSIAANKGYL